MTTENRLRMLMDAPEDVLSRVDRILTGGQILVSDPDPDVRTVTARDAAERLNISIWTVHRMVKTGELRSVPIRGITRILLSSVLSKGTVKTLPARRHGLHHL